MAGSARQPLRDIEHGGAQPCRWRVLIAVPPGGFGAQLLLMRAWLYETCGPAGWTSAPAGIAGVANDAVAFYFADPEAAQAFIGRFSCGYRTEPRRTL